MEGPVSGGSLITIKGTDLDTGEVMEAVLGNQMCRITDVTQDDITCVNMNSTINSSHTLVLLFDGHTRIGPGGKEFTYLLDPEVSDVNPQKCIRSGGNLITVSGERLNIIRRPQIVFTLENQKSTETCDTVSHEEMICRSPSLSFSSERKKRADEGGPVDVGFIMDAVTELLTWSIDNEEIFEYVRDPVYDMFSGGVKDYDASPPLLIITGRYLNDGSQIKDIRVYIGRELCGNVSLSSEFLSCMPPQNAPPAGDLNGEKTSENLPYVTVEHANLVFDIGYLRYKTSFTVVIIVVIAAAIVLTIVAISLVIYGKQRLKENRVVTKLEMQIAQIENTYHEEMRTLFTNLKTYALGLEGIVASLPVMPICSPSKYIEVFLYNGLQIKPATIPPEIALHDSYMKGSISTLSELLRKRKFLEIIFHALDESQIDQQERANIVAHICIILVIDGNHALITQLLLALIEKRIHGSGSNELSRPENIFKSGNSSLEILLSIWVALSFYEYVNDVRKSLQQLYGAIKSTVELGPIDAVTGKSQFSINDQYLLDKQIEFNELKLQVLFTDKGDELVELGFLSVDTITQVKSKIIDHFYQEKPFSIRPIPEQFDLVWCTRNENDRILRDDGILKLRDGWRKLNMLCDYKVKTGDCVSLIGKRDIQSGRIGSYSKECDVSDEKPSTVYAYVHDLLPPPPATHKYDKHIISNTEDIGVDKDGYLQPDSNTDGLKKSNTDDFGVDTDGYLQPDSKTDGLLKSNNDDIGVDKDGYLQPDLQTDKLTETNSDDIGVDKDGYLQPDLQTDGATNGCYMTTVSESDNNDFPDSIKYYSVDSSHNRQGECVNTQNMSKADPEYVYDEPEAGFGLWTWHLIKKDAQDAETGATTDEATIQQRSLNEIVLPYLPATRVAIQKYVNDMFTTFMTVGNSQLPMSIKMIFDFFDKNASEMKNPNLAKGWKDDVLPLKFWADLLITLDLIFDVNDCIYVKACLQILVQTLQDVCQRGKKVSIGDSPSKQLYSRLLPVYSTKLDLFYSNIRDMKELNQDNLQTESSNIEKKFGDTFDITAMRFQLYEMIYKYRDQICEALHSDTTPSDETFNEKSRLIGSLLEVLDVHNVDHERPAYLDIN